MTPAYSTLRTHRDPPAVRLEHDAAVLVGAVEAQPWAVAERGQRGRRRMAVLVVEAAGDDRHGRPQLAQFVREPRIGRAVVRDLEDLNPGRQQARGHVRL